MARVPILTDAHSDTPEPVDLSFHLCARFDIGQRVQRTGHDDLSGLQAAAVLADHAHQTGDLIQRMADPGP